MSLRSTMKTIPDVAKFTVEELADIDVQVMVKWIKDIPFEDWPQQSVRELRPSMVTNTNWHGFNKYAVSVIEQLVKLDTYQWMLSVVMPGHVIEPHKDQQPEYWKFRVHVPLLTNPNAFLIMGGRKHNLKVGKAYKVNVRETHAIVNDGKTPRVHFMFDVR